MNPNLNSIQSQVPDHEDATERDIDGEIIFQPIPDSDDCGITLDAVFEKAVTQ